MEPVISLVKIYTGRDTMDAHHVRAHLEQHGFKAQVFGETLNSALGELPFTDGTRPSVWVTTEDEPRAIECAQDFIQPPDEPAIKAEAWTCPSCAETVEGQFSACWQCGTERGGDKAE